MNSQLKFEDKTPTKIKIAKFLEGLMGREPSESEVEECQQSLFHLGKALMRIDLLQKMNPKASQ